MEYQHISHETLIGLKAGNERAFDTVYKQYYGRLCAFASQYVTSADCEEIVQDVMMWLWKNRQTIANGFTVSRHRFTYR